MMHYDAKTGKFTGTLFMTDEELRALAEGVASGRLRTTAHPSEERLREVEAIKAKYRAKGIEFDIPGDDNNIS